MPAFRPAPRAPGRALAADPVAQRAGLVWALLFVRIVGLGLTAGVMAIALTYCGMLGKVYAEILESSDSHPPS